ncbi:hypothetical protein GDO86_010576 [Hymenochirus boettgeri]|uniref:Uncharacterized protein n=1 Tax=Hymenochirus boettgeri TaxID=247094 RepID=A0A8T2JPZ1_9PIPI|nr:hypothetical protein GDO86_010576 [Hymenochirus boettgeri]
MTARTGDSESQQDNETKKSFSLEEKSKSSKRRVHYMKFAKGKDLSCRSDTDLACIFGKREKNKKSSPQEDDEVDSEENEMKESQSPSKECDLSNTVTSTLSVNEYFAKRMAELKKSQAKNAEPTQKAEICAEEPADGSPKKKRPKSKKKKHKRSNARDGDCPEIQGEEHLDSGDSSGATENLEPKEKLKKKKQKREGEYETESREEIDCEEEEKRRKRKNKKRKNHSGEEESNLHTDQSNKKKKKRKSKLLDC